MKKSKELSATSYKNKMIKLKKARKSHKQDKAPRGSRCVHGDVKIIDPVTMDIVKVIKSTDKEFFSEVTMWGSTRLTKNDEEYYEDLDRNEQDSLFVSSVKNSL